MPMLEVQNINSYYGKIHALKDVSISVERGEIVTIIGANGAGKSTMLRTTSGLLKPRSGSIRLEGEDLTRLRPHEIVMKGRRPGAGGPAGVRPPHRDREPGNGGIQLHRQEKKR